MKKILALLLSVTLLGSLLAGCGKDAGRPDNLRTNTRSDTLVVAYGANPNGDFIDGFGNNAYDLSIKTLLHGYKANIDTQPDGSFAVNPTVVKSHSTSEDAAGNKTYTFEIHKDLKWSDGSTIKASDYVANVLWGASPQWAEVGASSSIGMQLLGYAAYNEGESDVFAGVKLLGEYEFALTIDAEELPFFYENTLVATGPLALASWAPGVGIVSDESGARFDADIFPHADRIATTSGGERYAPTVVCGPYTFVSFENHNVTLRRNPHFKGDLNGKKPTIEWVLQLSVPPETDIDMLLAGDIDLLPNMIEGDKINRARADEFTTTSSYLRNGFGNMPMMLDWGPTADVNVRWAIACLVDRTALLDQVLEGFGGLVDSEYGAAQWMTVLKERELRETLIPIAMNIDRANDYLDQSTWVFEADGTTPWDRTKATADGAYLRHNAAGEPLVIFHAAANPQIGAVIELEFLKNTPLAGIKYNFDYPDFDIILNEYYFAFNLEDHERTYSTFSMGMGFSQPYDPYYAWHSDWLGTWWNSAGMNDPEIDRLTVAMRRVTPGDNETYVNLWFEYQVRWNELMPMIPLYSNEYFNLFNTSVKSVNTTPFLDWYAIICEIEKW